jgi:serine/threonine protein kinase
MAKLIRLGKYELIKRIAVGGMSEIYLASQGGLRGFERAVIVKCVREDLDTDQEVRDMFMDEARIAACLKHPNIVHLYDVGEQRGTAYLAMEYIFGRDLLQIAERLRLLGREIPVPFAVKIACDALAGLYYAHQVAEFEDRPLHVIHRDISPQNILVSFDGVTKVVDFGIAKAASRLSQTQAGVLKGKYAYMSPEQVRGKDLDHRSDQFSLATVLYETLTGTRLFLREDDYATMEAVDAAEIPPIRVLRKDIPRRLWRALRKALRKNPARRFRSCLDMERYLHPLLKGSPMEQTAMVARTMRELFADEIAARERAIQQAAESDRELIMGTGFEMLPAQPTRTRPAPSPVPPLAHERYQQILASRQGEQTQIQGPALSQASNTERTQPHGRPGRASRGVDWKTLLVVFVAVLLATFLVVFWLTGRQPGEEEAPATLGKPVPLSSTFRPGEDGFISISVRPTVRVIVDGKTLGLGAFHKHPLRAGPHAVEFQDTVSGDSEKLMVQIEADSEALLGPAKWQ